MKVLFFFFLLLYSSMNLSDDLFSQRVTDMAFFAEDVHLLAR